MEKKYVLGIDNGGTVTKAAIYDLRGKVVALDQAHVDTLTPRPLFTERDMEELWQANVRAIKRCLDGASIDPREIAALAVTGHGNGIYFVDKDGNGTRPGIISTDARAQSYADEWNKRPDLREKLASKTGSSVWAGQPTALLAWMDENEPDLFDRTDYVLFCKDYISMRLTGEARVEITDGTGVGMANQFTRSFDREIFEYLGIGRWFEKMPELVGSTDIRGYVTKAAAEATGLAEGTPVAGGLMDVAAGALAAGCTAEDELSVITGTWSINQYVTREVNTSEDIFLTLGYAIPNTWLVLEGSPNGVSNLDWYIRHTLRKTLDYFGHQQLSDGEVFEICERMILDYTPQYEDPFFLPYINGTPLIPEGTAGFVGLTAFHDIRHMVRAVYEGVIFSHMFHIEKLRKLTTLRGHVRFTGGAANSAIWMKMFADGIGVPLDIVDAAESGTLGAAIVSSVAAGLFPDVEAAAAAMTAAPRETVEPSEFSELFQRRYARFRAYIDALATLK